MTLDLGKLLKALLVLCLVLIASAVLRNLPLVGDTPTLPFFDAIAELEEGNVERVELESTFGTLERKDGTRATFDVPPVGWSALSEALDRSGTPYAAPKRYLSTSPYREILVWTAMFAIIGLFYAREISGILATAYVSMRQRVVGQSSPGRGRFDAIAGYARVKQECLELIELLRNPTSGNRFRLRRARAVLFEGPPGTGKTNMARAIAEALDYGFVSADGPAFHDRYSGVPEERIRDFFRRAREAAAKSGRMAVAFIDEVDAIGSERSGDKNLEWRNSILTQLLVEMDGFERDDRVLVVMATNRAAVLDQALLSRIGRTIQFGLPDQTDRVAILRRHAEGRPVGADVDFERVAHMAFGCSPRTLEKMVNEAALIAFRRHAESGEINDADFTEGLTRVLMGVSNERRLTDDERRCAAVHEIGHAVVAVAVGYGGTVHRVSILPNGSTGGYAIITNEEENDALMTLGLAEKHLAVLYGGREAEMLLCGEASLGASQDVKKASDLTQHILRAGFGDGLLAGLSPQDIYRSSRLVDDAAQTQARLAKGGMEFARRALELNKGLLDEAVGELLKRDVLEGDELAAVLARVQKPKENE